MDSGNLLWKNEKKNWLFFTNFIDKSKFSKVTKIYQLLRLCINDSWLQRIFSPFATMADGCKKVTLMEFFNKFTFFVKLSEKLCPKCSIHGKNHELSLFATVYHSCKEKNILRNHDSWLQRKFFPLPPWLTVAKRLISWDFPILFMKNELTSENMYLPMNLAKKSQFYF